MWKINKIGTYITRIENIEKTKVGQMVNYLINGEHGNHLESEIINSIQDPNKFMIHNDTKIYHNTENKKGKGGKPLKNSNKSLTFNIPKDYEATPEQVIDIQRMIYDYIKKLYNDNGYYFDDIDFFTNIHYQDNKHINILIPYLDENGKSIPFIKSQDKFLKVIAEAFTVFTDTTLGTNINTYMTYLDQMVESEKIMENMADLDISEIQELKIKHKDNKLIKRTMDYIYRIMNNTNDNDNIQKHIDNLLKTVDKVGKSEKLTTEEYEDFTKALRSNNLLSKLSQEDKTRIGNVKP